MEPPTIDAAVKVLPGNRIAVKLYDGSYAIWDDATHRPVSIAPTSFDVLMLLYPDEDTEIQADEEMYELVSDRSGQLVIDRFVSLEEALDRALEYCLGTGATKPQRIVHDGRMIRDRKAILKFVGPNRAP